MKRDDLFNLRGYDLANRYSDGFADGFAAGLKANDRIHDPDCPYCRGDETGTTISISEIHGRSKLDILPQTEAFGLPVLYVSERKLFGRRDIYHIYFCPMCGRDLR